MSLVAEYNKIVEIRIRDAVADIADTQMPRFKAAMMTDDFNEQVALLTRLQKEAIDLKDQVIKHAQGLLLLYNIDSAAEAVLLDGKALAAMLKPLKTDMPALVRSTLTEYRATHQKWGKVCDKMAQEQITLQVIQESVKKL